MNRLLEDQATYSRLEPVYELHNVRVLEPLEHLQLVENHALIAPDDFLQNDFNRDLAIGAICRSDDTVCAGTKGAPKAVLRPDASCVSGPLPTELGSGAEGIPMSVLLLVARGLPMKAVEHG